MIKQKMAALLSCVMLCLALAPLGAAPVMARENACTDDGLLYEIEDDEVTITGYVSTIPRHLTIPAQIEGVRVTTIANNAFNGCETLTTVLIPKTVTAIGDYAFLYCYDLTAITVAVDNPEFASENGVLFDKAKTSILQYPAGKPEQDYIIPSGVKNVFGEAFSSNNHLVNLTIPAETSRIDAYAFYNCARLASITVNAGNPYYSSDGGVLFDKDKTELILYPEAKGDASYTIPAGVTTISAYAFYECNNLTNVTLPRSVTEIGRNAFGGCTRLVSVNIPEGVTWIGAEAFYVCTSLTSVTVPASVTNIGNCAFDSCTALTAITVDPGNTYYSSADGVLFDKEQHTLLQYPAGKPEPDYTTPDKVTVIADRAFYQSVYLTIVTLSEHVAKVDENTFAHCSKLTKVVLPERLTAIGDDAFYGCKNLTTIALPAGLETLGDNVFDGCSSLTSIDVASDNAYYSSADGVLFNKEKTDLLLYPSGKPGTSYTTPAGVKRIRGYAFYESEHLTSITLSAGVSEINADAFTGCKNLTTIALPDSLGTIWAAFYGCPKLATVYYTGSEEARKDIAIYGGNNLLLQAKWHYNSAPQNLAEVLAPEERGSQNLGLYLALGVGGVAVVSVLMVVIVLLTRRKKRNNV